MKRVVGVIALIAVLGLSACGDADDARNASNDSTTQATSQQEQQQATEVVNEFLDNFREGGDLPEGWPTDAVVVPAGATPVASLANSTLPGFGEASAVFYASGQSGVDVADFFEENLPEHGWTVVNRVDQEGYSEVSVQGNGYVGIFGAGEVPSRPQLKSSEVIDVQVVLAKLSG
ncbi:MAG: hypothetical protein KY393_07870 [Actinobacteria bacterium]|nr:hypothetical protein [Actinomycetota bacterium]